MEQGYAISERDYQRIQETIRRVERMADINFRRRLPVGGWTIGGGEGMAYPGGCLNFVTRPVQLVKSLHCAKHLFFDNVTGLDGPCDVTMPTSAEMAVGDPYYITCYRTDGWGQKVYLWPNAGQTILMPGFSAVYGSGKAVHAGWFGSTYAPTHWQVQLVCCAANTWIAVHPSSSHIDFPD
jgi:hypothetical protein